ncbi:hypothetical protein ACJMK2_044674 [Sinanodonta woodiana]|uniref:Mitochondrial ribosomal protein S11 n=1 Tax=Sinanodonta woodiana TaxID=1069815 RepID=A0ABD3W3Y9_SINWO
MLRSLALSYRSAYTCLFVPAAQADVSRCAMVGACRLFHGSEISFGKDRASDVKYEMKKTNRYTSPEQKVSEMIPVDLSATSTITSLFPTAATPSMMIDGIQFDQIPTIHIHCSRNNTKMTLVNDGKAVAYESAGKVGLKNAKKGTNIAGQVVAATIAEKALQEGIRTVRVALEGMGPGRLSGVKGLTMSGLNVVAICDRTQTWTGKRPRKQRRL